jgi:hypothetical protein
MVFLLKMFMGLVERESTTSAADLDARLTNEFSTGSACPGCDHPDRNSRRHLLPQSRRQVSMKQNLSLRREPIGCS